MRTTRPLAIAFALAFLLLVLGQSGPIPAAEEQKQETAGPLHWTVEERIEQQLASSRALAGSRIRAAANGKVVSLSGSVRDPGQRQRALYLAARVSGGTVKDTLRVDASEPAAGSVPDADLARIVAEHVARAIVPDAEPAQGWDFGWRVAGQGWGVDVDVDDGDVALTGEVLLQQHIHALILAARDVPGVRSVRSQLGLVPSEPPEDKLHP